MTMISYLNLFWWLIWLIIIFNDYFIVKPQIEPFTFNLNTINEQNTAKVICTVIAGDLPIEIKWLKDGAELRAGGNRRVMQLDDMMVMLSLSALSVNDSGNYTCLAKNSAGRAEHTASLYVKGLWKG